MSWNLTCQAGIQGDCLELEVEHQAVVQKLLDMEGDLCPIYRAVVGEANFDGDVEAHVAVWVRVEGEGGG